MAALDERTPAPPKPSTGRNLLGWALRIGLFVGAFLALTTWQQSNLLPKGEPAPDFEVASLSGEPTKLSQFRGKPVLLHFWATWCGVCRQEFGALNALYDDVAGDAVVLSVVADSEDPASLEHFVDAQGLRYPVLLATKKLLAEYKIGAYPTTYFINPAGEIVSRTVGMSTKWSMRTRLLCSN